MTTKGQVTVPKQIRDELGLKPGDEVEFVRTNGTYALQKRCYESPFDKWHGFLKGKVRGKRTDELIREMRGE
jgi:AbrB family looped-hinge helix DNA binding protein